MTDRRVSDQDLAAILEILHKKYPRPRTALRYRNPFELLIATILSAQSTDEMVNRVTPALFQRCPNPEACLDLSREELETLIRRIGLYRSKARNILQACRMLVEDFGGEIPRTREELMRLPGVGRKTANVVLSNAFGIPAIAVDTHVFRVSNRLGIVDAQTPRDTEEQLMARIPRERWRDAHHWLILHGRDTCKARKPACERCELREYCPTGQDNRGKESDGPT